MRRLMPLFLFVLTIPILAAPQPDYAEVVKRADLVRKEADDLIAAIRAAQPGIHDTSVLGSVGDILTDLQKAAANLNGLITDARSFLATGQGTVADFKVQMDTLTKQIVVTLQDVDAQTKHLTDTMVVFLNDSRTDIHDIGGVASRFTGLADRLGGRAEVAAYTLGNSIDSRMSLLAWLAATQPGGSWDLFRLGVTDVDTSPKLDLTAGVARLPFSAEVGYIRDGLGVRLGYGQVARRGLDVSVQVSRLARPDLGLELGWSADFGLRPFAYGIDLLHSSGRQFGVGLGMGLDF